MNADQEIETLSPAAKNIAAGLRTVQLASIWVVLILIGIDFFVFSNIYWFMQYLANWQEFNALFAAGVASVGAICTIVLLLILDAYAPHRAVDIRGSVARAICAFVAVVMTAVMFSNASPATSISTGAVGVSAGVLFLLRLLCGRAIAWARNAGLMHRRAVIAGGGKYAEDLVVGLSAKADNDIRLYGLFDDRDNERSPLSYQGVPKLGSYDNLLTFVQQTEVDMVIIALPLSADERIDWLLDKLRILPVDIRLSRYNEGFVFKEKGAMKVLLEPSFAPRRRLRKRMFDIVFASVALILLWPVMVVAATAIWMETGRPILFQQKRHGYNNRAIDVLKFRSMYQDQSDPEAVNVVRKKDPRVTRVGRFLRRSSIDELPQLFDVIKGELSLVGPRPHVLNAMSSHKVRFSSIVEGYAARHRLPPGITGWAQINGWRGEIDLPDKLQSRFEHDLYYIENWSLWLDLKILFATPMSLVKTDAAY